QEADVLVAQVVEAAGADVGQCLPDGDHLRPLVEGQDVGLLPDEPVGGVHGGARLGGVQGGHRAVEGGVDRVGAGPAQVGVPGLAVGAVGVGAVAARDGVRGAEV